MYDPFAPAPAPVMQPVYQTQAFPPVQLPQYQPQAMPQTQFPPQPQPMPPQVQQPQQPAPSAAGNAMQALMNKHMNPHMFDPAAFQAAMTNWRGQHPTPPSFGPGARPDDWRTQMDAFRQQRQDWRSSRPDRGSFPLAPTSTPGV